MLLLSWDVFENSKESLLLLWNLLLGLSEWLLESIQDHLKLGLWNANLQRCLQWLRLHGIDNILTKAFKQLLHKGCLLHFIRLS